MLYSDSMPVPLPYLNTILEAARESDRSEREISRTATGQPAAISLLKTGRVPSVERVRRLCDALDLEFYIGPRRHSSSFMPRQQVRQVREARAPRLEFLGSAPSEEDQQELDSNLLVVDDSELLNPERRARFFAKAASRYTFPITPHVEVREIGIHGAESRVTFRRDWLDQHGIDPARSVVLGVSGESMEPAVPDGSSILVDCSRQTLRKGGVFVVRRGSSLVLKRAGEDADGFRLLVSDHPEWPDEPWPDDAAIFGEVKWMATLLS